MPFEKNRPTPSRVANTETYDGAVSQIIKLQNDELLLFYHENDLGHAGPGGRIVMRRSSNNGQTWSDQKILYEELQKDAINLSVVYSSKADRIIVFFEVIEFAESINSPSDLESSPEIEESCVYLIEGTDQGKSWASPIDVSTKFTGKRIVPHGGWVRSSNRILTCFYSSGGTLEILYSNDRGETWRSGGTVANSPNGRRLTEPVPCKITEQNLLLCGRDNATGDFFALKSQNGGETWENLVFFNPTDTTVPHPIWIKKTGPNRLTGVWGDRDDGYIYAVSISAQLAWQDPTAIAGESPKRIHKQIAPAETASYWDGNAGDFGYPTFAQVGPNESDILMFFYDESPWPNIWQMTLY